MPSKMPAAERGSPPLGAPEQALRRDDRRRGAGQAMAAAAFRDPPGIEVENAALQREIARILVKAPELPVELPAFDLTLLAIEASRDAIDLVLGKSSPIVRLRMRPSRPADDRENAAAVDVQAIAVHASVDRFRRQIDAMARRLRAAISAEKWAAAMQPARRLAARPVGVPLAFYRQLVPGVAGQGLVRVGFRCNQDCGICWQDRHWGRFDAEQILVWIEDLHAAGARNLIISGGEPTLDAQLEDYIRRARAIGFRTVTLETNAIQFARPGLAERLRDAGLGDCFVSLHSGDAATSDAITRAPGTFAKTVAGVHALLAAGVPVQLNCVMTREGIDHLEGVPDFVHTTFGNHPQLQGLMLSQPSDPFDLTLLPKIVPEPQRVRAILPRVIDRAFALGVPARGLDGPCGPPLCAFGADRRITSLQSISELLDSRTYLPACDGCAVRHACFGVRRADADLYGDACAQPLLAPPS